MGKKDIFSIIILIVFTHKNVSFLPENRDHYIY